MEKLKKTKPVEKPFTFKMFKKQFIHSSKLYFEPVVLAWRYINKPYDKLFVDDDE